MYIRAMSKATKNSAPPLGDMICFSVYAAGLAFNRLYKKLLSQFKLTYPQFLVLIVLRQHGASKVGDLGDALFLESNTLTPLLKRMESAGIISRRRDARDERVVLVALTKKGLTLVDDICCIPPQVLQATHMKNVDVAALSLNLTSLTKNLREHVLTTN